MVGFLFEGDIILLFWGEFGEGLMEKLFNLYWIFFCLLICLLFDNSWCFKSFCGFIMLFIYEKNVEK